jgi:RNA polymerase sigma-70 factor, ECF subfamily
MDKPDEMVLFEKIKKGNIKAFETLFHRYYGNLCLFASKLINNNEAAEEIVQDLFVKLWEKKEQISIESSIKNYLFRSVKNHCLNFIKHNKIKEKFVRDSTFDFDSDSGADSYFAEIDLAKKIEESIQSLPEKRREIFRLNRKEGLKYREIAEKLNLSIKTVEAQMGLAIKTLREKLKDYYPFLFLISFFK